MFPILKTAVILQIMQEVNVPLTEMELTEPGRCKERIREVFVQLVSIIIVRSGSGGVLSYMFHVFSAIDDPFVVVVCGSSLL